MLAATRRLALTSHKQFIKPQTTLQLFSTSKVEKDENNIPIWENPILHKIDPALIENPQFTHHPPKKIHEKVAYYAVQALRGTFDRVTKYKGKGMSKDHWLNRCLFLETVAGVPGMVGGMCRHLKSLRLMRRDNGWIHTLLEEAENERMHLLIFMNMRDPSFVFRASVVGAQMVFFSLFFTSYIISPKTCHRFVGYLEEEAVKTYTNILKDIETNKDLESWKTELAPLIARRYYKLADDASIYDMFKSVRADEANHRDVNHGFAALNQKSDVNPFILDTKPAATTSKQH